MSILKKIKDGLRAIADESPGERFQARYHKVHAQRRSMIWHKIAFFAGGILVVAIGIFFLPAPGPGMIIVAIGAGMIAQESLTFAKWLDAIEVKGRKLLKAVSRKWKKSSHGTKASAILALALCAAVAVYGSYTLLIQ